MVRWMRLCGKTSASFDMAPIATHISLRDLYHCHSLVDILNHSPSLLLVAVTIAVFLQS